MRAAVYICVFVVCANKGQCILFFFAPLGEDTRIYNDRTHIQIKTECYSMCSQAAQQSLSSTVGELADALPQMQFCRKHPSLVSSAGEQKIASTLFGAQFC